MAGYIGSSAPVSLSTTSADIDGTVTAESVTVNASDPFITLTDSDTGVDHEIDAQSGIGNLTLNVDKNSEGSNSGLVVNVKGNQYMRVDDGGDISFYEDTGTTAKFFWDASAESLALTTVGTEALDVSSTTGAAEIRMGNSNSTFDLRFGAADKASGYADFFVETGGTERMRIDSSGNVGIGTSSPTELLTVRGAAHFGKTAIETSGDTPVIIKSDTDHQALHIEENSGAESWQIGVDADGDLGFHNSGSATAAVTFDDSGNLLLGKTGASDTAGITFQDNISGYSNSCGRIILNSGNSSALNTIVFQYNGSQKGYIQQTTTGVSYNTSSDYRLKENVTDVTDGITRVKQLAPKRFNFIADTDDTTVDGFLAHEAQTVVPEAVTGTHNEVETWTQEEIDAGDAPDNTSAGDNKLDGDGNTIPVYQGIDQAKLVPLLTAALQEAIAKIETLETKVAALESA